MHEDDLKALAVKLSAIAEQLMQRSEQGVRRVEASGASLEQSAQRLHAGAEQFSRDALRTIGAQAQQVIAENVGKASAQLSGQLQQGARAAEQATDALHTQRAQLNKAQNALVWKGLAALLIGSVLAIVGSGYFAWKSMQTIEQARFDDAILRAVQSGQLTDCGKVLCAKAGKHPQRYSANADYVLLQP